jgi:hypothetical protein
MTSTQLRQEDDDNNGTNNETKYRQRSRLVVWTVEVHIYMD